jgi:hypothetical protein
MEGRQTGIFKTALAERLPDRLAQEADVACDIR